MEEVMEKIEYEDGCRQLKRCLETILQKLNTQRICGIKLYASLTITNSLVDLFLKNAIKITHDFHFYI